MDSSTPSLPVQHQLPESTQTHVHQVGDAIQPFLFLNTDFQQIPIFNPIPPSIFCYVFNTWGFWSPMVQKAYFLSGIPSGFGFSGAL